MTRTSSVDRAASLGSLVPAGLTMTDSVHRRMSADIVAGRLAPGDRLQFEMLKQRYEVGISPLREALQRLASESLVTSEGHVGFRVAPMSLADLQDINHMRLTLESAALRDSVANGDLAWESRVVAVAHQLSRTLIPKDPDSAEAEQWEDQHRAFHDALISACSSRWTLVFCRTLFWQFRRYRRIILAKYWSQPPIRTTIDAEHQRLVDAVLARNADKAVGLLVTHYENSARRVVAEYKKLHGVSIAN